MSAFRRTMVVCEGATLERFIARANIAHHREKLAAEQDEKQRQTLMRLLAEEEAKLTRLDRTSRNRKLLCPTTYVALRHDSDDALRLAGHV
jgi:hypothetical protein